MPRKILIIEDDPTMLKILQSRLLEEGVEVLIAVDPDEGIRKAKEEAPDLVVLDVITQGKSGVEVLEELKSKDKTKNIPVIVFTITEEEKIRKKMFELGATDFIIKGVVPLEEVVKRLMDIVG